MRGWNKIIFLFSIFFFCLSAEEIFPQSKTNLFATGIYTTYTDYIQHKMKSMDDYVNVKDSIGKFYIIFVKKGKNQIFDCSEIWGFQYKYKLFRSDVGGRPPARVISAGKIVYYENGLAHLDMLKYESEEGNYTKGAYCYISNNLLGKMIPMPNEKTSELYKEAEQFKGRHKQYKLLFECIEKDYNTSKIHNCVRNFERGN